jgi:hypothetical protein
MERVADSLDGVVGGVIRLWLFPSECIGRTVAIADSDLTCHGPCMVDSISQCHPWHENGQLQTRTSSSLESNSIRLQSRRGPSSF